MSLQMALSSVSTFSEGGNLRLREGGKAGGVAVRGRGGGGARGRGAVRLPEGPDPTRSRGPGLQHRAEPDGEGGATPTHRRHPYTPSARYAPVGEGVGEHTLALYAEMRPVFSSSPGWGQGRGQSQGYGQGEGEGWG